MKVLLIEDESRLLRSLALGLEALGHSVTGLRTGEEALAAAAEERFDAAVIDIGLPGIDGFEVTRRLRQGSASMVLLIATARTSTDDFVRGLDDGADDYVTKPIDLRQLDARLRAVMRRARLAVTTMAHGSIALDTEKASVTYDGVEVALTRIETRILATLIRNPGDVIARDQIRREVWGLAFDPGTRLVDVHISNLRRKLEADGRPRVIVTVPREGFVLRPPGEDSPPGEAPAGL